MFANVGEEGREEGDCDGECEEDGGERRPHIACRDVGIAQSGDEGATLVAAILVHDRFDPERRPCQPEDDCDADKADTGACDEKDIDCWAGSVEEGLGGGGGRGDEGVECC